MASTASEHGTSENYYDVTAWPIGDPYTDIGEVINSIIADIKHRQQHTDVLGGGKPGATIYIPSGDYHLTTPVVIDISYLRIMGAGHGFVSSSIRFNIPKKDWPTLHELWPGGSRIIVDLPVRCDEDTDSATAGAAFLVTREGNPRISSVEFSDFCIDGLHFVDDGSGNHDPENTYLNGKTGIYIASAQDSFRITGMGFIYLEHAIIAHHSDALSIHDNFIAECGNCIELRGSGQASKITDNLIGAGYRGYSIFAENFGGLLITANNVFPRGASTVYFENVSRSSISSNRFHAFYPGVIVFKGRCSENLIAANHIYRSCEPWPPMKRYDNGLNDHYGLIRIQGTDNSIIANHISLIMDTANIRPSNAVPVVIRLVSGTGNYISSNHTIATTERCDTDNALNTNTSHDDAAATEDFGNDDHSSVAAACFSTQVEAVLSANCNSMIPVTTVLIDPASFHNTVLDSGTESQTIGDRARNAFRATPIWEN